MKIEVEREALKKEKDSKSIERLKKCMEEIKILKIELKENKALWEDEKKAVNDLSELKEKLETAKFKMKTSQRHGNYTEASKYQYDTIPNLKRSIEKHTNALDNTKFIKLEVTTDDVADIVSKWTGIPVNKMLKGEKTKLLKLEEFLRNRVVGQDHALKRTSDVIRMSKMGLTDIDKPIGSFLFMGNTGVGKTELAKTLAEALFDDEKALVRIDMSELMEEHSVSKLIGSPPGYIGYDEGGSLTESIRRRPYSVILFDEIEKANRNVLNILLQILDDGRLTDSKGRTVNFKNTIIIMTTNLCEKGLKQFFRPELRNRIDDVIKFNNLSEEIIKVIIEKNLQLIVSTLNKKRY